ncbi:hypothetical protein SDC9_212452 [bioreactor metagenome]|uniref:Uncharacterized protein n=1 Tax=bioreactor metagenome TaxID=1076179 RepID=A0A645JMR4_9ZZZZ
MGVFRKNTGRPQSCMAEKDDTDKFIDLKGYSITVLEYKLDHN